MPKDKRGRTKLSKSVLEMKFMQRTKNRIRAEEEAEEGRSMYGKEITTGMKNAVNKFIVQPSYAPILGLIVGRISYGGYNPEIEKFMTKPAEPTIDESDSKEMQKEISDNEMAEFSSSLGHTMARKFNNKKARFMKPED